MRQPLTRPVLYLAAAVLLVAWSPPAGAQWVREGVALSTSTGSQGQPQPVSDAAGGAIIAWLADRGGPGLSLHVQRVDAHGVVQWAADGIALSSNLWTIDNFAIGSDGAGGAVVAWSTTSTNGGDIFAQGVDASGNLKWPSERSVCSHAGDQRQACLASDGAGGVIIAWEDRRGGLADIYAQRFSSSGAALWALDGIGLCTAAGGQAEPAIATDGSNGAIVAWKDYRTSVPYVYAQRVGPSGIPSWTAGGIAVCYVVGGQSEPVIVTDGAGGAIVGWTQTAPPNGSDIHAQRLDASGTRLWNTPGVGICKAMGVQDRSRIVSDGAGGAIFTWDDQRDDGGDIYAQRVDASGAVQWDLHGTAVCTEFNWQRRPELAGDGSGGAILAWIDARFGHYLPDLYAQHVDVSGAHRWPVGGIALWIDLVSSAAAPIASGLPNTAIVPRVDHPPVGVSRIHAHRAADPEPGFGYCFGDPGSGALCPCGNDNDGSVSGSGCANGTSGAGAQLTGSGEARIGGDTLVLAATGAVPIEFGLYFQADQNLGPGLSWGDGLRCTGGGLKRLQTQPATGWGNSATTLVISAHAGNVHPGDTKHYQLWYRDPVGTPCGAGFNSTNGYAVTWGP